MIPLSLLSLGGSFLVLGTGRVAGSYAALSAALTLAIGLLAGSLLVVLLSDGEGGLGVALGTLTALVTACALLSEWGAPRRQGSLYPALVLALSACLYYLFGAGDLYSFYIGFEIVLVPLVAVIGIWGSGAARIRAAFLFFLYTLAGSLLMLVCLILLWWGYPGPLLAGPAAGELSGAAQIALASGFALAFAVKTPLMPFHTWLFRAHAQAPVGGSVLLAGLVLKLSA
jgi:NADH:ubiquinone oxidoreductase subunit 4 (subunit M)